MMLTGSVRHLMQTDFVPVIEGPLVVAVSGGVDSLVLLHILWGLRASLPLTLHVATLDHGLRGDAGAEDARFVVETCRAWGIPVTAGVVDVPALAQAGRIGIEESDRLTRYRFLARVARDVGANIVATAHHAGDQAETVLMRILRGTGGQGLAGILPRAPLPSAPDLTVIRPLLDIPRAEIEAYAREHGLTPREDATNQDTAYLRNRLRHDVLPLLREINPQVDTLLAHLAESAAHDNAFIEDALQNVRKQALVTPDAVEVPRSIFRALHSALRRRLIAWAARYLGGDAETGAVHIQAALDVADRGEVGARALLPGGRQLRVDYDTVIVERVGRDTTPEDAFLLPPETDVPVAVPGVTETPFGWQMAASVQADSEGIGLAIPLGAEVRLRTRRAGDRMKPAGMGGHSRKLQDVLTDDKVPRALRDRLPLLTVDGEIAAILSSKGWRIAEPFVPRADSERVVYIGAKRSV